MNSIDILKTAAEALNEKKAVDLFATRIAELTVLTDYFLIANGTSTTHVRSLAEEVEDKLSKAGVEPKSIEGRATGWILLDYGSVVVHVFTKEARETYSLERLWVDGEQVDLGQLIGEEGEDKQ